MNWYGFIPTNKYAWVGFVLIILGFLTLPLLIGIFIMPIGVGLFVFGIHKALFDLGKKIYNFWVIFKPKK